LNDQLLAFVDVLREGNVKVSQAEVVDAYGALPLIDVMDRSEFRETLAATLIKDVKHRALFDRLFDVFFPLGPTNAEESEFVNDPEHTPSSEDLADELREQIVDALLENDLLALRLALRRAVTRFAGIEKGRPVGGVYYTYRTLRQIDLEEVLKGFLYGLSFGEDTTVEQDRTKATEGVSRLIRSEVESEVLRRLVGDRGSRAVAKTLALKLPEDVDIVHASKDELEALHKVMEPLARKLASRLAQRHISQRDASLDFRRTVREAMSYGGTPARVYFRKPKVSKPEVVLLSDISGSVASFARFTMQLLYAMTNAFSKIRSFVFIDTVDEVTKYFSGGESIQGALLQVTTKAKVVGLDGHSDYGNSLSVFEERYMEAITKRTTVIVCGDARNNYHPPQEEVLGRIKDRAKKVFWLNPEPKSYWNSGDSVVSIYGQFCDGVFECRTLRQLEEFVVRGV
jgi:uncharacterized protein with von Willebrand factor type A (vWA) domain